MSLPCGPPTAQTYVNPVDYAVWSALQQLIYRRRKFSTAEQLKVALVEEWGKISQRFIDRSVNEWRHRLEHVVQQQGGHIEQVVTIGVLA